VFFITACSHTVPSEAQIVDSSLHPSFFHAAKIFIITALCFGIEFHLSIQPEFSGKQKHNLMLRWSFIFLVVALVAALFGFTQIAVGAAAIAKFLFFLFAALFVLALLGGVFIFKK
jgi:uncharacterized membrane protein YtjA (UPF0391 family)